MPDPVLSVTDLATHFFTKAGVVKAVDGVSFALARGEVLGLVGESGSGKSVTGFSLLGLVDQPGRIFRARSGSRTWNSSGRRPTSFAAFGAGASPWCSRIR